MKHKKFYWSAGGILLLLLSGTYIYGEMFSLAPSAPSPNVLSEMPDAKPVPAAVPMAPTLDIEALAAVLGHHLDTRIESWSQRAQERSRMQLKELREWRRQSDAQALSQAQALADLGQRLSTVEQGVGALADAVKDPVPVAERPEFLFRGIEIWHGQSYALLEYEGRILPARQGESRLGWRVRLIDRERQNLHVSDGYREVILEAQ